jgi:hypothetical protein
MLPMLSIARTVPSAAAARKAPGGPRRRAPQQLLARPTLRQRVVQKHPADPTRSTALSLPAVRNGPVAEATRTRTGLIHQTVPMLQRRRPRSRSGVNARHRRSARIAPRRRNRKLRRVRRNRPARIVPNVPRRLSAKNTLPPGRALRRRTEPSAPEPSVLRLASPPVLRPRNGRNPRSGPLRSGRQQWRKPQPLVELKPPTRKSAERRRRTSSYFAAWSAGFTPFL